MPSVFVAAVGNRLEVDVQRDVVLPAVLEHLDLVRLAGVVGAIVSAPIAALASLAGPEWSLRYAFVLFVLATIWAIRLPGKVDSSLGEDTLALMPGASAAGQQGKGRTRARIPAH